MGYLLLAPALHVWPPGDGELETAWTQPINRELVSWHAAADRIFTKPTFGFGFQGQVPIVVVEPAADEELSVPVPLLAPPRNLFLLIWLNLGLVGALCFGFVIVAVGYSVLRAAGGPLQAAVMAAAAVSILAPAVFGAGSLGIFWLSSAWCVGAAGLLLGSSVPRAAQRKILQDP